MLADNTNIRLFRIPLEGLSRIFVIDEKVLDYKIVLL